MKTGALLRLLKGTSLIFFQKNKTPKSNSHAFTLIELLVVMAILTVVAVAAVPIIASEGVANLRATYAIDEVKAMMLYAQRHAIQTQVRTRVTFNVGSADMRLHRESTPDTNTWTVMKNPKDGSNWIVSFGTDSLTDLTLTSVNIGGPPTQSVIFDRYGTPYDRGTVGDGPSDPDPPLELSSEGTIEFNGASGWQIAIVPETGYLRIVDL